MEQTALAAQEGSSARESQPHVSAAMQESFKRILNRPSAKVVVPESTRLPLQVLDVRRARLGISVQQPPLAVRLVSPGRIKTKQEVQSVSAALLGICRIQWEVLGAHCVRQANLIAHRGQQIACAAIRDMQARLARRNVSLVLLEHSAMNAPSGCSIQNQPSSLKRTRWF